MNDLEKIITKMDFRYFGTGQHKIDPDAFLKEDNTLFLDVRATQEVETLRIPLQHHCQVLEIPTNEVPARLGEIPKDKTIGVFCSAGVRATVIYTYLKSKGYDRVKIIPGGYAPLLQAIMPGKLFKHLNK